MTTGIDLARQYHRQVVAPLLHARWPRLPHAAGRLGTGSDVLGLDDDTSRDHDWGLRLTLLVTDDLVHDVERHLVDTLPDTFAGLPTRFATTWDPAIRHRIDVTTAQVFVASRLGLDASGELTSVDWLCLTGQSLLEVTSGEVFTDTVGVITQLRAKLSWYPDDLWRHVLAADWKRLAQDLPLLGRTGQRGDRLGSHVLAGRLAGTCMHLAFLLARRWPPYPKWLGTLLADLPIGPQLIPHLTAAVTTPDSQQRQQALAEALDILHQTQRDTGLPTHDDGLTEPFFDRPFLGIRTEVGDLLLSSITDPHVKALPHTVGSVEQWVDNVDILSNPWQRTLTARAYLTAATHEAPD